MVFVFRGFKVLGSGFRVFGVWFSFFFQGFRVLEGFKFLWGLGFF